MYFVYAYLISFAHNIQGSVYIFACVIVSLVCKTHAYPVVIFIWAFLCAKKIKEKNVQGVLWQNPWEPFTKNPRGGNLWGFCLYSSTDHQRKHISENTFLNPLFFKVLTLITVCSWGCFQRCYVKITQATWWTLITSLRLM